MVENDLGDFEGCTVDEYSPTDADKAFIETLNGLETVDNVHFNPKTGSICCRFWDRGPSHEAMVALYESDYSMSSQHTTEKSVVLYISN